MSASKFHTAMLWLTKERSLSFGKRGRTGVQKEGTSEADLPEEPVGPVSIPATPELLSLSQAPSPKPEIVTNNQAPNTDTPAPQGSTPAPDVGSRAAAGTPLKSPAIPAPSGPVAVLTLDGQGEIVSAAEACEEVFGCGCAALAGGNVRLLLKGGFDNELGQFLDRHRAGKNPAGTTTFRVTALRKDGTEFTAHVTAVTWSWDTTVVVKGMPFGLTWTAAFRDVDGRARIKATPAVQPKANPPDVKLLPEHATPQTARENVRPSAPETAPADPPSPESCRKAGAHPATTELRTIEPGPPRSPEARKPEEKKEAPIETVRSESPWEEPVAKVAAAVPGAPPPAPDLNRFEEELKSLRKERDELAGKLKAELERSPGDPEAGKRFEEQLALLRQERDELTAKLSSEQSATGEMKYRLEELEKHLSDTATAKADLTRERDELFGKLTAEQLVAAELNYRLQELENQWGRTSGDLEQVKAVAANREQAEAELRAELETAKQAAFYMEAALKEEVARREKLSERLQNLSHSLKQEQAERSKRFEQEMIALRQERDELDAKLATEQKETAESARRARELEERIKANADGFERARTELERETAERERAATAMREQFQTAVVAKKELEGANKRFEEELAHLRKEHDELEAKLAAEQQAAAESRERAKAVESRLGKNAAEFDRAKAELEQQEAERERVEAEWREQLDAAQALRARLELSLTEAREKNKKLETELLELRGERNELKARVTVAEESKQEADDLRTRVDEQETKLEEVKAALEKQTADQERTEAEWRKQLDGAHALSAKLEFSLAEAKERHKTLQDEIAELRQERDDYRARLSAPDVHAAENRELKAALVRAESRSRELNGLRRERDELKARLKSQESDARDAAERAEELERRLARASTDFQRVKADLEKQLETAAALARKSEAAWSETIEDSRRLEAEVAALQHERDALHAKLVDEKRAVVSSKRRPGKKPIKSLNKSKGNPPPEIIEPEPESTLAYVPPESMVVTDSAPEIHQYDFTGSNGNGNRHRKRFKL